MENGALNGIEGTAHSHVSLSPDLMKQELQQCKVIHRFLNNATDSDHGNSSTNVRVKECEKWEYDTSQFTATIVSKVT